MPELRLPVPLGTYLWRVQLDCCYICKNNPEKTAEINANIDKIHCEPGMICYTKVALPEYFKFEADNIAEVVKEWKKTIFVDRREAMVASARIAERNRNELEKLGVKISNLGCLES